MSKKLQRTLHIVADVRQNSGGPARSVPGLIAALEALGVESHMSAYLIGDSLLPSRISRFHIPQAKGFWGWYTFLQDLVREIHPEVIFINGLWDVSLHLAVLIAKRNRIPYVIVPRGMLQPWALLQKAFAKKVVRFLWQDRDIRGAAALHVTAREEREQMRHLGFRNEILEAPNGVNVPETLPPLLRPSSPTQKKRVLFLSRMSSQKGVANLIEAWGILRPKGWECEMVYTTNTGESRVYEKEILQRIKDLYLENDFVMTGGLSDDEKWKAYRRANLFVLPTNSENFGIVIAEALYAELPVVTTKGAPWAELEEWCCGKWIDIGVTPLVEALREMLLLPESTLAEMGKRGRELIEHQYLWPSIAKKLADDCQRVIDS